MAVHRSLADWLEVAIWPGVSSDYRDDERRMRSRVRRDDGSFADPAPDTVTLVPVDREVDDDRVFSSERAGVPLLTGSGGIDLLCGGCASVVCRKVGSTRPFVDLVFACPCCDLRQRLPES